MSDSAPTTVPAWLRAAAYDHPQRFDLPTIVRALPDVPVRGPRSLALARSEVLGVSGDPPVLRTAVLGLAGAQSPLPALLARELATLEPDTAAAGLFAMVEERLLRLLVAALARRAVDDPAAYRKMLERLAGPLVADEVALAGRLCDGRTADALARRVALAARCPVRVETATGGGLPIGPQISDRLGDGAVGHSQTIGGVMHAPQFGCRIVLGPVSATEADLLRPGGRLHQHVLYAVQRGLPTGMRWELILRVRPAPAGIQLGRSARLAGEPPLVEDEVLARYTAEDS